MAHPQNALVAALCDRSCILENADATLVTRFFLESIEQRGLRIVPVKPTRKMQAAIYSALDEGKRLSVGWVRPQAKTALAIRSRN